MHKPETSGEPLSVYSLLILVSHTTPKGIFNLQPLSGISSGIKRLPTENRLLSWRDVHQWELSFFANMSWELEITCFLHVISLTTFGSRCCKPVKFAKLQAGGKSCNGQLGGSKGKHSYLSSCILAGVLNSKRLSELYWDIFLIPSENLLLFKKLHTSRLRSARI